MKIIRYLIVVICASVMMGAAGPAAAGPAPECADIITGAEALFVQGDYTGSYAEFVKARECVLAENGGAESEDSARLLNRLGRAAEDLGDYDKAAEYYRQALDALTEILGTENHPDVAESIFRLGLLEFDRSNSDAANALFARLEAISEALGDAAPGVRADSFTGLGTASYADAKYEESLELVSRAVDANIAARGEAHFMTARAYQDLATLLYTATDYQGAYNALIKCLDIYNSLYGEGHPRTAAVYEWLGYIFMANSEFENARVNFVKSLDVRRTKLGERHPDTVGAYSALGYYYFFLSEFEKAKEYYLKAMELALAIYDENHPVVADGYNNLAMVLDNLGDREGALEIMGKSLDITIALKGEEHPDTAFAYSNISVTLKKMGDYASALEYANKALEIWQNTLGPEHPDILAAYNGLGMIYIDLGDFDKAAEYLKEGLRVCLLVNGRENPTTGVFSNNLGFNYESKGDYDRALEYYTQAAEIYTALYGEKNDHTATVNSNIGMIYSRLGNTEKSLEYTMKAIESVKEVYGEKFYRLATFYNNIGMDYVTLGEHEKALDNFQSALEIWIETAGGEKHPDVATAYGNIGNVYSEMNDYEKAAEYEEKAVEIYKNIFGESHPDYARTLTNLSVTYNAMGLHEKALEISTEAVKAMCGGKKSPEPADCVIDTNVVNVLRSNAAQYTHLDMHKEAAEMYVAAADMLDALRGSISGEAAKKVFGGEHYQMFPEGIGEFIAYATQEEDPKIMPRALDFAERGIGRVFLEMIGRSRATIDGGLPPEVLAEGAKLEAAREESLLAVRAEEIKPRAEQDQDARRAAYDEFQQVEAAAVAYNARLLSDYPDYAELMNPTSRPLKDLEKVLLTPGTAIMEFYVGETNSYLIFDSEKIFTIEYLPGEAEIDKLVDLHRMKITNPSTMMRTVVRSGEKLFDVLMGDVEKYLDGVDNLLIVPTGRLYFLPFETLVMKDGDEKKFLVEKFRVRYAPSLNVAYMVKERGLKRGAGWSGGSMEWLGFGDPIYSMKDGRSRGLEMSEETERAAVAYSRAMSDSEDGARAGGAWLRLPGTEVEVKSISELFSDSKADVNIGVDASERRFREEAARGARFLHLATHGSLGEGGAQQPALVLSLVGNSGGDDGFLTMSDVFNMKIPSELVVLSACKTGQGKMEQGEGVAGMARAFLYAGADSLVVSLWSVADKETKDLMISFYNKLIAGAARDEAIAEVKREMIANDMHPYFWAPFIFIGGE